MALTPLPLGLASQRTAEPEVHDVRAAEESIFALEKRKWEWDDSKSVGAAVGDVFLSSQNKYLTKKTSQSGPTFRSWPELCWRRRELGSSGHGAGPPKSPRHSAETGRDGDDLGTDKTGQRRMLVRTPMQGVLPVRTAQAAPSATLRRARKPDSGTEQSQESRNGQLLAQRPGTLGEPPGSFPRIVIHRL